MYFSVALHVLLSALFDSRTAKPTVAAVFSERYNSTELRAFSPSRRTTWQLSPVVCSCRVQPGVVRREHLKAVSVLPPCCSFQSFSITALCLFQTGRILVTRERRVAARFISYPTRFVTKMTRCKFCHLGERAVVREKKKKKCCNKASCAGAYCSGLVKFLCDFSPDSL